MCLFDKNGNVDFLPRNVFFDLEIETIILLEASVPQIIKNLSNRDNRVYSETQISLLKKAEYERAKEMANSINCNFYNHQMHFDETDVTCCLTYLERNNQR